MYKILDQEKETVAYIQNMMILNKKREKLIGLLIGDCFFGNDNKVIGKIIDQTVYLLNGEIVGKIELNKDKKDPAPKKGLMLEAWDIIKYQKSYFRLDYRNKKMVQKITARSVKINCRLI